MADIFREGWTERIQYRLSHDGTVLNLAGFTVGLVGEDGKGVALGFAGSVGIADAATGLVYFDPAANDLVASRSPYKLRWSVTDGSGKTAYFPRAEPLKWRVDLP